MCLIDVQAQRNGSKNETGNASGNEEEDEDEVRGQRLFGKKSDIC